MSENGAGITLLASDTRYESHTLHLNRLRLVVFLVTHVIVALLGQGEH